MAIVYQHRRLDTNEIFYIGIGKEVKRAYSKRFRNQYWKHITNKIDYIIEIIHFDLSWEEACEKEKELIKLYGRKDLGQGTLVNMTDGGEGVINNIITEETREKMSNSKKGIKRKPMSEETKQKLSQGRKGHSWNKGMKQKPITEETREKMSNSKKGTNRTEETKQKISESLKGKNNWVKGVKRKPLTQETKEKISLRHKGRISPNKGKPMSEEQKEKLRKPKQNKIKKLKICL